MNITIQKGLIALIAGVLLVTIFGGFFLDDAYISPWFGWSFPGNNREQSVNIAQYGFPADRIKYQVETEHGDTVFYSAIFYQGNRRVAMLGGSTKFYIGIKRIHGVYRILTWSEDRDGDRGVWTIIDPGPLTDSSRIIRISDPRVNGARRVSPTVSSSIILILARYVMEAPVWIIILCICGAIVRRNIKK